MIGFTFLAGLTATYFICQAISDPAIATFAGAVGLYATFCVMYANEKRFK